jgi:hypothetical protein
MAGLLTENRFWVVFMIHECRSTGKKGPRRPSGLKVLHCVDGMSVASAAWVTSSVKADFRGVTEDGSLGSKPTSDTFSLISLIEALP